MNLEEGEIGLDDGVRRGMLVMGGALAGSVMPVVYAINEEGLPLKTERNFATTATTLATETLAAYIARARPAAVIANIHSVVIVNKSNAAIDVNTGCVSPYSLAKNEGYSIGGAGYKQTDLNSIIFPATPALITVAWSEFNA